MDLHTCSKRQGFSLVELLMVIAILGIISTIATPILLQARVRAIDAKSISSLRAVSSAEFAFYSNNGRFGSLAELADPPHNGMKYLDARFLTGDLGNDIHCTLVANGMRFRAETWHDPMPPHHRYTADDTGLILESQ